MFSAAPSAETNRRFILPTLALFSTIAVALFPRACLASAWPVERQWTEEEEQNYSRWVERIASKQWRSANVMLHSKELNSLYDKEDDHMFYYSDCGDLPYIVRAYYAFKRRLPYVWNVVSGGRYTKTPNTTEKTFDNLSFKGTAQQFFTDVCEVSSANYRTAPQATDSFTYPIAINPQSLRPGMVFYSPNGHCGVVVEVRTDGTVKLIDAHPDQTVTRIAFGPKLEVRSRTFSGGFRGYRPVVVKDGEAVFVTDNSQCPNFSREQYEFKDYFDTLQQKMAKVVIDPLVAFENYIREDTFQEVLDRVQTVEIGWPVCKHEAVPIPPNIYDAEGDWEAYSSPSRDLRLRLSMLYLPNQVRHYMRLLKEDPESLQTTFTSPEELGLALLALKEKLFGELKIEYTNGKGQKVPLTLNDIEQRLFKISFDPNHAPELRWGASGDELKTMDTGSKRYSANYEREQWWRNRLEKKQGPMDWDDDDNPRKEPRHDITPMIREAIAEELGKSVDQLGAAPVARPAGDAEKAQTADRDKGKDGSAAKSEEQPSGKAKGKKKRGILNLIR
ncbi:MAG: hypothetical protein NTW86_19885 [Candidatus Sumerlaeota bacterium]|nr:hypothetical protein [Candidatus Sumerlaeota bacterium]